MRKVAIPTVIIGALLIAYFVIYQNEEAQLTEEKLTDKKVGDFILHMKVEREPAGIEVHQSIQYVGKGEVKIYHQAPLISVSIVNKNHDFTGSLVPKVLRQGSIYYQDTKKFQIDKRGEYNLFVQAKFFANDELVKIEHVEPLLFR